MGKAKFSEDFKQDAVHQITERGYLSGWALPGVTEEGGYESSGAIAEEPMVAFASHKSV